MKPITCTCGGRLSRPQLLEFPRSDDDTISYSAFTHYCRKCNKRYTYSVRQRSLKEEERNGILPTAVLPGL